MWIPSWIIDAMSATQKYENIYIPPGMNLI